MPPPTSPGACWSATRTLPLAVFMALESARHTAVALVTEPAKLLLDEPFSALDVDGGLVGAGTVSTRPAAPPLGRLGLHRPWSGHPKGLLGHPGARLSWEPCHRPPV